MIPKIGHRFFEKIMLKQRDLKRFGAKWILVRVTKRVKIKELEHEPDAGLQSHELVRAS
jgi:hypothetical protein